MLQNQELSFESYRLELGNERLWRGKRLIPLTSKASAVLHYLVERPHQLVRKDELFAAIWPDTVVGDAALTVCIRELRKALGDKAKKPRFIQTVYGRGYRFIAPLYPSQPVPSPESTLSPTELRTCSSFGRA